mgnify:CR=1 FL=1
MSTKDEGLNVSPNSTKPVVVGSLVRFYDCDRANKDRNHSGEPKYYSVGMVINRKKKEKPEFLQPYNKQTTIK